jgi:hypothetical protein
VHGCHNSASDPLRNSCECYYYWSYLGSVIVYELLVELVAMMLKLCVLLKVLRLVRVTMSDFALRSPTRSG